MPLDRNDTYLNYRAALARYRAAWKHLGAENSAGHPPTPGTRQAFVDAQTALHAARRLYSEADPYKRFGHEQNAGTEAGAVVGRGLSD
jgi:hypothetical protein